MNQALMSIDDLKKKITEAGLRITPQRIAVLNVFQEIGGHPTADEIIHSIQKHYPNISIGTIYNILDAFVRLKIITKVISRDNINRYDAVFSHHHHLYAEKNGRIEDYNDKVLSKAIDNHLKNIHIPNFEINGFELQITGEFKDEEEEEKDEH